MSTHSREETLYTLEQALDAVRAMPGSSSHVGHERQTVVEAFLVQAQRRGCLYPGCDHTRRTRGLCHAHYQIMRDRARKWQREQQALSTASFEADLERRGLLLPKGTGGVSARDHLDAFCIGSEVLGC